MRYQDVLNWHSTSADSWNFIIRVGGKLLLTILAHEPGVYHVRKSPWTSQRAEGEWEGQTSDGWSDEGFREAGSQKLEDQGQG